MLSRTDSLTHGDCGNQDMVTISELCLNRIESYTTGLSGYKYSTVAVDYKSGVWAFLLRAFCLNISCPISGIQPFFAPLQSDLEQIHEVSLRGNRNRNTESQTKHGVLEICIPSIDQRLQGFPLARVMP